MVGMLDSAFKRMDRGTMENTQQLLKNRMVEACALLKRATSTSVIFSKAVMHLATTFLFIAMAASW